jgi:hypothetical protein
MQKPPYHYEEIKMQQRYSLWIISVVAVTLTITSIHNTVLAAEEGLKSPIPNEICLECHDYILEWNTGKEDILQPHRLHLESKRTEYDGRQKMCVTCHEAWVPADPGWMDSGVYHPDVVMDPKTFWRRNIQRKEIATGTPYLLDAFHPEKPYTFKPLLERLVCVDCHGPDSKVKTFYGTPLKE